MAKLPNPRRLTIPAGPLFHRALSDPALVSRLSAAAVTLGYRLV
jgi:hypothetical protein